jgi:formylmethanofuran dehydrogenase subunit E
MNMTGPYSKQEIEQTIAFHGHSCPGLAIGIRAAELARERLGAPARSDLVAVAETDMCGVDAIQFLTGCTYGKGNFIHKDLGKMAFSFYDRKTGRGFRAVLNPAARIDAGDEMVALMKKVLNNTATEEEKKHSNALRGEQEQHYMQLPLEEMFLVADTAAPAPRRARILDSLPCSCCGEMTMESRTRRFDGQTLCIPCFEQVEQKV